MKDSSPTLPKKPSRRRFLLALAGLVFSLSACGGGGGGSSGAPRAVQPTLPPVLDESGKLRDASSKQPVAGSVTQGSRGDTVTADRVRWMGENVLLTVGSGSPESLRYVADDLQGIEGLRQFRGGDGVSSGAVAVVTSRVAVPVGSNTVFDSGVFHYDNTDPLVFGVWAYVGGGDEEGDFTAWGTFADGQTVEKTPASAITPLTGSPQYDGQTFGVYENPDGESGPFVANIRLYAQFGEGDELGTIGGSVYNFADGERGGRAVVVAPGPGSGTLNEPWVVLKEAPIGAGEGGFFTGDTAMVPSGATEDNARGSGKWGGQFFGPSADHIGGTWGVSDSVFSAVGAFGAERQSPP